jgi:Permease family
MLAGIVTPPLILGGAANLPTDETQYLISASLIVCGILSSIQITRFHIYKSPYYLGTGLIRFVHQSRQLDFFFWGILWLMVAWSELRSPQFRLPRGRSPNGMQMELAPPMLRETNSPVRMATVRFWGRRAFAHCLKLGSAFYRRKYCRRLSLLSLQALSSCSLVSISLAQGTLSPLLAELNCFSQV